MIPLLLSTFIALVPANTPYPKVLDCIAMEESGGEQFTPSGQPLWSPTNDVGLLQINQLWIPTAKRMGLDIVHSAKDNATFGIWLMNTHGLSQWTTYKKCKGEDTS